MGRVRGHLSISLDGFGAGRDTSHEHPLGVRGEQLHEWVEDVAACRRRTRRDSRT